MACLIIIGQIEPLLDPFSNRLELYNNFTIIILAYCLMLFTEFVPSPLTRYDIGFVMIFLTAQNIAVNLAIIARSPIRQLILRCRRYHALKKVNRHPKLKTLITKKFTKKAIKESFRRMKSDFMEEKEEKPLDTI